MRRSAQQVIHFIENHLAGTEGPHDWDDFTSMPIPDPELNAVRLRCVQLDYEHPDVRVVELRAIIQKLRGLIPATSKRVAET